MKKIYTEQDILKSVTLIPNIVFVIDGFKQGGAQEVIRSLSYEFCKNGAQVEVIIFQKNLKDLSFEINPAINVTYLNARSISDARSLLKLKKLLKNNNAEIIYSSFLWSHIWTSIVKKKEQKLVWVEQNTYNDRSRLKWSTLQILSKRVNKIYCCSEEVKDVTISKLPSIETNKIEVVKNPIYVSSKLKKFDNQVRHDYIFIGRMVKQKNPLLAVKVFEDGKKEGIIKDNQKLNLVGEGELIPEIKAYVHKNKLDSSIRFLGELDIEKTHQLLSKSKVLISTSTIEGFGLARVEALHYGCCLITTSTGGISALLSKDENDKLEDLGIYFTNGDKNEFINAMQRIETNNKLFSLENRIKRSNISDEFTVRKVAVEWLDKVS